MPSRRYSIEQIAGFVHELPAYRDVVAEHFADRLGAENPRFDRRRFMAAAIWGIEERRHGSGPSPMGTSSPQDHIDAAARHERAAESHERSAKFWDSQCDRERAELQRDMADYERRGAELDRRWGELLPRDPA